MTVSTTYFVAAPHRLAPLLFQELQSLGLTGLKENPAGVYMTGSLEQAYRVCLWSRIANRVLLPLATFAAADPDELYAGVRGIDWDRHLSPDDTLAVEAHVSRSQLTHSQFVAQKVKDAVVDYFWEHYDRRPSVQLVRPNLRLDLHLDRDTATLSLDLASESLHRRGYREEGAKAPMKENLAAALLMRAGWPAICAQGGSLVDPLCGSGTLPIEAALMAADIAPGLRRVYFGFLGWKGHDAPVWTALKQEAATRCAQGLARPLPSIVGFDQDRDAVRAAQSNVARAGLVNVVHIEQRRLSAAAPVPPNAAPGLVITNPPYGERLGVLAELPALYAELGQVLKQRFNGWQAAVFTGNPELGFQIGLRSQRPSTFFNGALECQLLRFNIAPDQHLAPRGDGLHVPEPVLRGSADSDGAQMLANRLRKNRQRLKGWLKQTGVTCYRLYDADLPEYAVAIDIYQGDDTFVHVQEYEAPSSIDADKAAQRLADAMAVIPKALEVPAAQVFLKVRRRQKGKSQYEKLGESGQFYAVSEGKARLWVNFSDYLDTGLFLDHRITRRMIHDWARGARFLNLFAYTGAATVHAALGGAATTTTVDMSATYLDWAKRNMTLNGIGGPLHRFVQADCLMWLDGQSADPAARASFDLIFLDPPTFSTSKRMEQTFDVQRDHVDLIRKTMQLLAPGGRLVFSNNRRGFKLAMAELAEFAISDITRDTIPEDYARNPKIHGCWVIQHSEGPGNG